MHNPSEIRAPDHGPWSAELTSDGTLCLSSDDFRKDVLLKVSGDFGGGEARKLAYGQFLADVLTRGCKRARAAAELEDAGGVLAALRRAATGPHAEALEQAADEVARLRAALADAAAMLERLEARAYFTSKVKEAAGPSAFAQALESALGRNGA